MRRWQWWGLVSLWDWLRLRLRLWSNVQDRLRLVEGDLAGSLLRDGGIGGDVVAIVRVAPTLM